jgi:hypothetical protein
LGLVVTLRDRGVGWRERDADAGRTEVCLVVRELVMPPTCTHDLFSRLTTRMGSKKAHVVDAREIQWFELEGEKPVLVASGALEPLFVLRPGKPLHWLVADVPNVPAPRTRQDADELAFAMASAKKAVASYAAADSDRSATYYAITTFAFVGQESAQSREDACMQLAWSVLLDLSSRLIDEFPRYGSAGARQYSYTVADTAALIAATATYYAHGTAVQGSLAALAEKVASWSMRAAIPTDEALRVAAEIGAESAVWKRSSLASAEQRDVHQ